jgi:aminopeptidase N/puromycin-sensitive aminopeptidase
VNRRVTELAHQYLKNPRSVDPSIAPQVLAVAAIRGDKDLFAELDAVQRDRDKTPEHRLNAAQALGMFSDSTLSQKWLETIVKDTQNQDSAAFIAGVLHNVPVQKQAWEWVKQHWSDVEAKLTAGSGSAIVGATRFFCDAAMRNDARQFFADHKVEASEQTLKQAQEISESCIKSHDKLQSDLAAWLQQRGAGGKVEGH